MMIDFEINDKGTLVWNDGSSRPATHQEQELTYEIAYRDDQIKALQAEVERLKAAQQKEGNDHEFGIVELTQGFKSQCDLSDLALVNQYKWYPCKQGNNIYAVAHSDTRPSVRKSISMHRLIMGAGKNEIIDHINGDSLDNRRCNLRFVTKRENAFNSASRRGASKYKGVTFRKDTGKWRANIRSDMGRKCLGSFATEVEAAAAYNQAAIELHGEHARLNILEGNIKTDTYDADKFVLVPVELAYKQALNIAQAEFNAGFNIFEHEHRHLSHEDKAEIKGRWLASKAFYIQGKYKAMIAAAQEPT